MNSDGLIIKDLHTSTAGRDIIKGLSMHVKPGEIVALMGPNGSGKSTLAYAIMGHPGYEVNAGSISYRGHSLDESSPEERSKMGIFLSFQQPVEIPGLRVRDYLKAIREAKTGNKMTPLAFRRYLQEVLERLGIDESYAQRYLNEGFSGGEKKRMEVLQMAVLEPTLAVLDETDSGLDIDALRSVAEGVNKLKDEKTAILVITHYQRMLNYLKPDRVLIMMDGRIVQEGPSSLVEKLESEGYAWLQR